MKKNCLLLLLCCFLRSTAPAQTFTATLSGNPVNTTEWTYGTGTIGTGIGGGTSIVGSSVQLNGQVGNAEGYIYYDTAVNLAAKCNEFTVNFDFQIFTPPGGGADGFTFYYITNTPSTFWNTPNPAAPIGSGWPYGEFLNMPSNPDGLVLIFDIYNNNSLTDAPLQNCSAAPAPTFHITSRAPALALLALNMPIRAL